MDFAEPAVQLLTGLRCGRYAGVNPVAFDIANNWCEYAADYHADPPHQLDYSLLPDKAHQARGCSTSEVLVSMSLRSARVKEFASHDRLYISSSHAPDAWQENAGLQS